MPYTLYPTVDDLLQPALLSRLTGQPIDHVETAAMHAFYNKSGSQLFTVETNHGQGPRLVLKRVSPAWDWQMRITTDIHCRSVALWQYGIFDRLPAEVDAAVIACARDGDGWAILMRDVGPDMMPYAPFTPEDNETFLEAMAAIHAAFLDCPDLAAGSLGLCTLRQVYTLFGPETGHQEPDDDVPRRVLEGWVLFPEVVPRDVADVVLELVHNPDPLCRALSRFPHTLAHGDWRHANQGLDRRHQPPKTILLDWQLAAFAPPVIDLARYLETNSALLPGSKEETIALYRRALARRLGPRFSDEWWQPQLELGLLGGFVQDGWAIALKATRWHITAHQRPHWQADLQWWSEQVRQGVKWL
ncbi:MAG: hypothetical protein D6784_02975 [Chloroflexi bacterium]|nr:MAG: hypothetical protein D6784_02975 [Chloroflexota bacterium]